MVQDVKVTIGFAIDPPPEPVPRILTSGSPDVTLTCSARHTFLATLMELNPGSGRSLFTARVKENDFSILRFTLTWNDHAGVQRKLAGIGDLRSKESRVSLAPEANVLSNVTCSAKTGSIPERTRPHSALS